MVCCQFLWNAMYKYTACGFYMKSLETAEQMARRLTGNAVTVFAIWRLESYPVDQG